MVDPLYWWHWRLERLLAGSEGLPTLYLAVCTGDTQVDTVHHLEQLAEAGRVEHLPDGRWKLSEC